MKKRTLTPNRRYKVLAAYPFNRELEGQHIAFRGESFPFIALQSDDGFCHFPYRIEVTIVRGPKQGRIYSVERLRLHIVHARPTCQCAAYPFPHKKGTGKCQKRNS